MTAMVDENSVGYAPRPPCSLADVMPTATVHSRYRLLIPTG